MYFLSTIITFNTIYWLPGAGGEGEGTSAVGSSIQALKKSLQGF